MHGAATVECGMQTSTGQRDRRHLRYHPCAFFHDDLSSRLNVASDMKDSIIEATRCRNGPRFPLVAIARATLEASLASRLMFAQQGEPLYHDSIGADPPSKHNAPVNCADI